MMSTSGCLFSVANVFAVIVLTCSSSSCADDWPALPERDAAVQIPAQEWRHKPGPRQVKVLVHYPGGRLDQVTADTGVMLSLHNWGGVDCQGTASPTQLARRLNLVVLCVNYLQSGPQASIHDPEAYDFGYLQGLDALRALYFATQGLQLRKIPFAEGRIYATGGSGGGNVTLMANKLAPRTFACVIDMCGMARLSNDIAFNLPGGSDLNARWSRDPKSPNFLSADDQEIRFIGHPEHLRTMRRLQASAKVIVVHGSEDRTCPIEDAREMVANMQAAHLDVEPYFLTQSDLDGKVFASTGHSLGNRTEIVFRVAEKYLRTGLPTSIVRKTPSDFDRRDDLVQYTTPNGTFVISYAQGYPVGTFKQEQEPVEYKDHQDLTYSIDQSGQRHPVKSASDWEMRRQHIVAHLQRVMGKLPGPEKRVPLDVKVIEETRVGKLTRRKITFQSEPTDRVPAYVFIPDGSVAGKTPAVLCLHQTTGIGKGEPAGIGGHANQHTAVELAERGFITLAPDYPSFGEHTYDFTVPRGYDSGSMKAVWDNIRSVDLLLTLPEVDASKIGCIGHSLGGHSAIFTAVFEPRIQAVVSSCGFTRFDKDDLPSWTGPNYMPRIASTFKNDPREVPFDFTELIACLAPRPFLACAAQGDADFDVTGVRDVIDAAKPIYSLFDRADNLDSLYPPGPHDFPPDARRSAYEFLAKHLIR